MSAPSLRFPVGRLLGAGAFSEVYEAQGFAEPAVVKVSRAQALTDSSATGGVFAAVALEAQTGSFGLWDISPSDVLAAEVTALKKVRHPAFPSVLEDGLTPDKRRFAVMQRVAGQTWRDALSGPNRPGLPELRQLIEVLVAVKRELPWHGDLKPENLMLTPERAVRVLDPVSACTQFAAGGQRTKLLASPWYNPLLLTNDVFSFGVLMLEVLGGQHPLLSANPSAQRKVSEHLKRSLVAGRSVGLNGEILGRLTCMRTPVELGRRSAPQLDAVALKCMGLKLADDTLDLTPPFSSLEELVPALSTAAL